MTCTVLPMDIYCPKCGEPWDNDCLHEEADERKNLQLPGADYTTVARQFASKGCAALSAAYGPVECTPNNSLRAMASDAMFDLMGDDVDGVASMMDDFDYMGLLD